MTRERPYSLARDVIIGERTYTNPVGEEIKSLVMRRVFLSPTGDVYGIGTAAGVGRAERDCNATVGGAFWSTRRDGVDGGLAPGRGAVAVESDSYLMPPRVSSADVGSGAHGLARLTVEAVIVRRSKNPLCSRVPRETVPLEIPEAGGVDGGEGRSRKGELTGANVRGVLVGDRAVGWGRGPRGLPLCVVIAMGRAGPALAIGKFTNSDEQQTVKPPVSHHLRSR